MTQQFDPGYIREPFITLARDCPGEDVHPPNQFRVEWGPRVEKEHRLAEGERIRATR